MLLKMESICSFYGDSQALFDINLSVDTGEIVCLFGRNGAGKTTTIRTLMGLIKPRTGKITLAGRDITGKSNNSISRQGIGYVPQGRHIFPNLTTRENLEVAIHGRIRGQKERTLDDIYQLFPQLRVREKTKGVRLSGGEQQMLSIARALIGNRKLLLMDEPSEGLAPLLVSEILQSLVRIREEGFSILLAEQNALTAMKHFDARCYIYERGGICWEGNTKELREDRRIVEKYLGV